MKKYIKGILLSLISVLLIMSAPATIYSLGFYLPAQFENTFYAGLQLKVKNIKNKSKKRIILIGGSSVPFGIRSDLIKLNFPEYDVVNFGLYASLGTKVMLDIAKKYVGKDDVVIISPEQHPQSLSMYFNNSEMWKAVDGDFDILKDIDRKDKEKMWGAFPSFVGEKCMYYYSNTKPNPEGVYNVSSFNSYGDIEYNDRKYNIMVKQYDVNNMITFDNEIISDAFITYLNEYSTALKKNNAKFYYHFGPMNVKAITQSHLAKVDEFYNYLDSKLNFSIIGNPHQSIMDNEWFYDTNYHLNSSGAVVNTLNLVSDLKILFNDNSQIYGTYPDKPIIPSDEDVYEENNTDQECYSYQEKEDYAYIVGLTELSKNKTKINIPTSYNGKPIRYFTQDVFTNNENIEEVTINNNIKLLFDNSFNGSNIQKIIIKNNYPNKIQVGSKLLNESDANIYVSKSALVNYKTDYSWSVYSDRLFSFDN